MTAGFVALPQYVYHIRGSETGGTGTYTLHISGCNFGVMSLVCSNVAIRCGIGHGRPEAFHGGRTARSVVVPHPRIRWLHHRSDGTLAAVPPTGLQWRKVHSECFSRSASALVSQADHVIPLTIAWWGCTVTIPLRMDKEKDMRTHQKR